MNALPRDVDDALPEKGFSALLGMFNDAPSIGTDDVIGACLPLLQQVADVHDTGRVAPLADPDALGLAGGCLFFRTADAADILENPVVSRRERKTNAALEIVDEVNLVVEESDQVLLGGSNYRASDRRVAEERGGGPSYLTGYRSWEIENGHHDPLTDIFVLGLILASLATGLDFNEREHLETFVGSRRDLQRLNGRLHPVLVRAIERMTALERFDRAPDLRSLCEALENYRRIGSDFDQTLEASNPVREDRDTTIVKRLRARLYDTSRRNRLLYHRPIAGELNLTEASVPLVINPDLIKADDLFTGTSKAMNRLVSGKELILGDWIRFEEMLFAPTVLSRLRLDAMRVEQDLGTSPLRLIPVMLHWYDLKNAPDAAIASPLLLLKARLTKKKGVRDAFVLGIETPEADLNPALSFVLNQLYGIVLPERVDLSRPDALRELYETIRNQVLASEPGVSFRFVDKPRRRLLHTTVRRRLDQFQRRQRGGKGVREARVSDYSYDVKNYKPLGVQLFRQHVRFPEAPFRSIAGRPLPRYFNLAKIDGATQTEKSQVFVQHVAASEGRFDWSFDASSVVLGNFNYQKMSLLRDYDRLTLDPDVRGPHFARFFGRAPRESMPSVEIDPQELRNILPSDPSQDEAIAAAQSGASLVLQGPPGTGKSQTIANLIANFVSHGKRILFVSQKRAALDVVCNRLSGAGLGDLTAAFHDVKTGRSAFVEELGKLYKSWSDAPAEHGLDRLDRDRAQALERVRTARASIDALVQAMAGPGEEPPLHRLLEWALAKGVDPDRLSSAGPGWSQAVPLPRFTEWERWRDVFAQVLPALSRASGGKAFGALAESRLDRGIWRAAAEGTDLSGLLERLDDCLSRLGERICELVDPRPAGIAEAPADLVQLRNIAQYARALGALESDVARAAATGDPAAMYRLEDDIRALEDLEGTCEKYARLASVWVVPLALPAAQAELAVAQANEGRFFARFLSSRYRSVQALIQVRTDLSGLAAKPSATQLLTWLVEHLKAREVLAARKAAFERRYGCRNHQELLLAVDRVAKCAQALPPKLEELTARLRGADAVRLKALGACAPDLEEAVGLVQTLFGGGVREQSPSGLLSVVRELRAGSTRLPVFAGILGPLASAPDDIWALLTGVDADVEEIERCLLCEELQRQLDRHPQIEEIDVHRLALARRQLDAARAEIDRINADLLKARQRNAFRNDLVLSNRPAGGLTADEKARRDTVLAARRILENEFSKSRAFRSVRDLVQDDCGHIVSTIKPIWMMSPTSIADVLPLQKDLFDVVIFDEASQITVEEALPACVRAQQIVVVGDSKQLPPTSFFGVSGQGEDFDDEDHDFELDQESLLTLADEKMPNVMLRWHYRSRHEALIAFSNTAFYAGRLLSIPAPALYRPSTEIVVPDDIDHRPDAETVLGRALGFHYLPHGIYSARSNEAEAAYVARLLRSTLMRETGLTIGIVAFSEAQQRQIEDAIARLAEEDERFAQLLAEEQERKENGEFVGMFVKNLENVQGDERDIMIVSVCYGPSVTRKIRMNFGPVNKLGGEKRLNVIFSRARRHMAIVSSITGDEITNDYNTGALALKTMLQFARASSAGLNAEAERIFGRYRTGLQADKRRRDRDAAVTALADWIKDVVGIECDIDVGLSDFVIDLVPRLPADRTIGGKPLAILVDRTALYERGGVQEMLTSRALILEGAGWEALTIPLKDIWGKPREVALAVEAHVVGAPSSMH
jgi:hypothetical protein